MTYRYAFFPKTLSVSSYLNLPKCHPIGFEIRHVPDTVFRVILEQYNRLEHTISEEIDVSTKSHIHNIHGNVPSDIIDMSQQTDILNFILNELKPMHESWCGMKLENAFCFGIRSYNNGSVLKAHVDRFETHHISSIIIVDKNVQKDWPLDIKDHNGQWHKIYADVGQMILYESAICEHGRKTPLEGDYFRNLFVHYKFKNIEIK